ncbi:MAG: RNA 2',3'-cyclic phosphodiesterase [Planctomycetota bacterium]|nr:MAG: RNA 2',3'-cyclic phosphodiesterase [Planctomycetota bacterium]
MRCFFACPLPTEAVEALVAAFAPLRAQFQGQGCHWIPPENLHVTMRFLGEADRGRLFRVTESVSSVIHAVEAPQLHLDEPGLFPPKGPRSLILWAGLRGEVEALGRLARAIESCARDAGFAPERRSFRAHVTLARLDPRRAQALQGCLLPALPEVDCTPAAVNLYQSQLSRSGAQYCVLRSWPLRRSSASPLSSTPRPFNGR